METYLLWGSGLLPGICSVPGWHLKSERSEAGNCYTSRAASLVKWRAKNNPAKNRRAQLLRGDANLRAV